MVCVGVGGCPAQFKAKVMGAEGNSKDDEWAAEALTELLQLPGPSFAPNWNGVSWEAGHTRNF